MASLEARTGWTKGLRWQQERFKSDSRKNPVTTKHRDVLSKVRKKSLGSCLKDTDKEAYKTRWPAGVPCSLPRKMGLCRRRQAGLFIDAQETDMEEPKPAPNTEMQDLGKVLQLA